MFQSQGIADKATASNVASMELLRTAAKSRASVVNELNGQLADANKRLKVINDTIAESKNLLGTVVINRERRLELGKSSSGTILCIYSALGRCFDVSGNRQVLADKVTENANKIKETAEAVASKVSELKPKLDEVKLKALGGVGSKEAVQLSSKHTIALVRISSRQFMCCFSRISI